MLLIINTTPADHFELLLARNRDDFKRKKVTGKFHHSEKLVPAIASYLTANKLAWDKLRGIGVVVGPGGFTSVRIGVAVANALAFGRNLPIAGIKADEFASAGELVAKIQERLKGVKPSQIVLPYYDREPNITKAKIK
ncbi:MAG: tRNA (adenosine(37)-N6)-threonylcarbamoyltransferase complex dimerization subunit type 1 TsaB [Patescibacteria group bacterium]|jgi:tRNA threonylcarbamoyl adenosine modification protein YeaZ